MTQTSTPEAPDINIETLDGERVEVTVCGDVVELISETNNDLCVSVLATARQARRIAYALLSVAEWLDERAGA